VERQKAEASPSSIPTNRFVFTGNDDVCELFAPISGMISPVDSLMVEIELESKGKSVIYHMIGKDVRCITGSSLLFKETGFN